MAGRDWTTHRKENVGDLCKVTQLSNFIGLEVLVVYCTLENQIMRLRYFSTYYCGCVNICLKTYFNPTYTYKYQFDWNICGMNAMGKEL